VLFTQVAEEMGFEPMYPF